MLILGLTGGIACGKSTVSQTMRKLGAYIVDGDELSRRLTAPQGPALPAIRAAFGERVFREDGTLNRRALGDIVFSDDAERQRLNGILQPMILALIDEEIRRARKADADVCVLDMPLLYEEGLDRLCDRVWCVTVDEETQISRIMERDGLTHEQALGRIRSQMPTEEKASRADVCICTSGTIEEAAETVRECWENERKDRREEAAP